MDSDDNLYIADAGHFLVRKVATRPPSTSTSTTTSATAASKSTAPALLTLAGSGSQCYRDGSPEIAGFGRLSGIAVDSKGCVYVSDYQHHTVRKVSPQGTSHICMFCVVCCK